MMNCDHGSNCPRRDNDYVGRRGFVLISLSQQYTRNSVISTPHNVTHSLISRNPRERTFIVQISLLIVTFHSFISQDLSLMQTTKEVNPHHRIAPCVHMWSATFLFLFFLFFSCHLLNVVACVCHIAREGQVE
jgi:hypothetical protein